MRYACAFQFLLMYMYKLITVIKLSKRLKGNTGWMDLNEIWHKYESLYEVYRKCRFSLPVRSYRRFTLKNIDFCPGVFSETARDN